MIQKTIVYISILFSTNLFAQNLAQKGIPFIQNFDIKAYQGDSKTWDITQAPNGFLYFANGENLLEYDGINFNKIKAKQSIIRSVYAVSNDSIYAGMDDDFGLFLKENDSLIFKSLYLSKKSEEEDIEEFWNIFKQEKEIVFQSFKNLYVFNGHVFVKIPAKNQFNLAFKLDNEIYISDKNNGLFKLKNTSLIPVIESNYSYNIKEGFFIRNQYYFVCENQGILELKNGQLQPSKNNNLKEIASQNIFTVKEIGNNWAIGTVKNGLYIIDKDLNIVQHFSKKNGLLNNTVLAIQNDAEGNIWLGLDYGISYLNINSNTTYFHDYYGSFGTAYTALKFNDDFYVGTNQGLYKTSWSTLKSIDDFGPQIPFSNGQVWSINRVGATIFVGHDKGTFLLNKDQLELLSEEKGAWKIIPFNNKNYALSGNYNGIIIYEKAEGKWRKKVKLEGFEESAHNIFVDQKDHIWVGLKTKGIFRLKLNPSFDQIIERSWYPIKDFKAHYLHFFYQNGRVFIRNNQGKNFIYNALQNGFEETKNPIVMKFKETKDQLWYDDDLKIISDEDTIKVKFLNDQILKNNLNNIISIEDHLFFPIHNGFAFYKKNNEFNKELFVQSSPVFTTIQSLITLKKVTDLESISAMNSSLKFYFTLPFYAEHFDFQYQLDDGKWSKPFSGSSLILNRLEYGNHQLKIRAIHQNLFSKESSIQFNINRPWYARWYSFLAFFLVTLLAIATFIKLHKNRMNKQERLLTLKKKRELIKQEQKFKEQKLQQQKQIIELENEKLKVELNSKNRELAKVAQVNLNKNRVVEKIRKKFMEINEASSQKLPKRYYKEMISTIDYYLSKGDDKIFEINFDKTHESFFDRLQEKHPNLTMHDLRICAFLKMNLSSKEIAALLGINSSSVDVNRSRLRKKMNLHRDNSLPDYLRKFR